MATSTRARTAFGLRLYEARLKAGLTQVQVREALGISQGSLSDLEREGERSAYVPALANLYGVDPYYLATGEPPKDPAPQVAHSVSYSPFDHPALTREEWMTKETLPGTFVIELPDDAMGKDAPAGCRVVFQSGLEPRFGDGVLLQDGHGRRFVREYAEGARPGEWEAKAVNSAFRTFNSQADSLTVLAVWIGELSRRRGRG